MIWIFDKKGIYKFKYLGHWFYVINENIIDPQIKQKAVETAKKIKEEDMEISDDIANRISLMLHARDILVKKYNLEERQLNPTFFYEFPDREFYITEPRKEEDPGLSHAKDITDEIVKILPKYENLEKRIESIPGIPDYELAKKKVSNFVTNPKVLNLIVSFAFENLLRRYLKISSPVYGGVELYKSLQPVNFKRVRSKSIANIIHEKPEVVLETNFPELQNRPDELKSLKKLFKDILEGKHEVYIPQIKSMYEQMAIDIISTLVYNKPYIRTIRFWFKPADMAYDEFREKGILTIGKKDLIKRFKLTREEIQKIFLGRKNSPPAIMRLENKPVFFKSPSGIYPDFLFKVRPPVKTDNTHFIEVYPRAVFYSFRPSIKDDLWKLRVIGEKVNPKAQGAVLALRNKFITLRKPLAVSFETLAGYAGLSSRRWRKKTLMKKQITEYLDILKSLGDIDYEITKDGVKIHPK